MNQIVSLEGKDSTAMLITMFERGEKIHSVVWFKTGWDFPCLESHIQQVENYTGIKIVRLKPKKPLEYWMFDHDGKKGWGWPSKMPWCRSIKRDTIRKYQNQFKPFITCIGYGANEIHRIPETDRRGAKERYPLVEYGITNKEALRICYRHGFDFGGLYRHFDRVACYCCPQKNLNELRYIRKAYPGLWAKMLDMDSKTWNPFKSQTRKYIIYGKEVKETINITVHDLERRFKAEDRQLKLYELERVR